MGAVALAHEQEPRLEDAVLEALAAARGRRTPVRCVVCGGAMRSASWPGESATLRCVDCLSELADAPAPAPASAAQLRLVT
jgi:hypothetical protein